MTEEYKAVSIKIVLIGDSGVGKTTLVNRYVMDTFDPFEPPTLSGGFRTKEVVFEELKTKVSLQIWDTAGQERFKALVENYYKNAQFAIVWYDITQEESFDAARNWIEEVKEKAPEDVQFYICATKSDLNDQRSIQIVHGIKLAKEYNALFGETSAKKSAGVNEAFEEIARNYVENYDSHAPVADRNDTVHLEGKKTKKKGKGWKC